MLIARIYPRRPAEGDWQARALTILARGARSVAPRSLAALRKDHIAVIVPGADDALSRRAAESSLRAVDEKMTGFVTVIGRSRIADDPMDLHRSAGGGDARRERRVAGARASNRSCSRSRTPAPTGCSCRR